MLELVRKFLKNHSPDWLNVEVNKDLLPNLTANFTTFKKTITSTNYDDNYSSDPKLLEELGVRAKIQPTSKELKSANSDLTMITVNDLQLPTPGTPHWRRIRQVFQVLDNAPNNYTYNQLIKCVKETTGVGCSRKLISKWKKQRQNLDLLPPRDDRINGDDDHETKIISISPAMTISEVIPSSVNSFQLNQSVDDFSNNDSLDRPNILPVKTWSYLAAAGLMISLVGCEIIPLNNNRLTKNIAFAEGTTPLPTLLPTPETRKNQLEPSKIEIELTLDNPTDLKVKPGDKISAGQTLSNRVSERNRLQAQKKQLQLSLEKLNLPLTPIPQPKPIPEISKLPPVSYASEEAAIKYSKQNLKEAENAIALQQKKIDSIDRLLTNSPDKPTARTSHVGEEASPTVSSEKSNLKLVIEHERASLKNLEAARQEAQIQLEVQESQLTTAKEQRAYIEYQRQLEQTQRAIALQQQWLSMQNWESERSRLVAEREYSKAQISAQIQEIDYQIEQLSTVKAPYEGTIKKVKWTGQSDHNLTALITLAVNDDRSTIARSTGEAISTTEIRETREEDK
jgi:hypothetical protein